jgi:predicted Zn finger-like uncharacterized protein
MIVTCPGCASKYRVKSDAVPDAGARMRCPKCETLFFARPPTVDGERPPLPSGPSTPDLPPAGERPATTTHWPVKTATSMAPAVVQGEVTSSRAMPRPRRARSRSVMSWGAVAMGGVLATVGATFAAWTSEAIDLDARLLPVLESRLGITPPISFVGRDMPSSETLAAAAIAAEQAGDAPTAVVLWRRVRGRRADDPAPTKALQRLLVDLGEPVR